MIEIAILVTVNSSVSMKRLTEIADELGRNGMTVSHTIKSLNMVIGSVGDLHLIPELRKIADIKNIIIK